MKKTLLILTFLFLGACAKENNGNNQQATVPAPDVNQQVYPQPQGYPQVQPQQQQPSRYPYQYNYPGNNCNTGPQRYRTRESYCEGLRNDRLNGNCAIQTRYQNFRDQCHDQRWQR